MMHTTGYQANESHGDFYAKCLLVSADIDQDKHSSFKETLKSDKIIRIPSGYSIETSGCSTIISGRSGHNRISKLDIEQSVLLTKLYNRIDAVQISAEWYDEVEPPTLECKEKTKELVKKFIEYKCSLPVRISATAEEGMFIKYMSANSELSLSIEIYNDLDIGAIISKDKKIVASIVLGTDEMNRFFSFLKEHEFFKS